MLVLRPGRLYVRRYDTTFNLYECVSQYRGESRVRIADTNNPPLSVDARDFVDVTHLFAWCGIAMGRGVSVVARGGEEKMLVDTIHARSYDPFKQEAVYKLRRNEWVTHRDLIRV